jgi:hypothetical protein
MLWAISSYFNPAGYSSRLRNYRTFKTNLTAPLAVVELSLNGNFELREGDAEIVVQIAGGDAMWQKERLLNVALNSLPRDCDQVAWVDCDVIFANPHWVEDAEQALRNSCSLLQLYRERCNLRRGSDTPSEADCESSSVAVGYKIAMGEAHEYDISQSDAPITLNSTAGLAWAAPREWLAIHGLYDACILGSGDRAILCAALGRFESGMNAVTMRGRQEEHYLAWAEPFHKVAKGRVGFIDGRILHLWHGDLKNRRYSPRNEGLVPFNFDPFHDIAVDPTGCWRWNSHKPEMHEYVKTYFDSRKEDG